MSLRGNAIRNRDRLKGTLNQREPKRPIYRGMLGDGTGGDVRDHCMVDQDPNEVYVRVPGRGVIKATYTANMPIRHDLPVLVGPTQEDPNTYEVLNLDRAYMQDLGGFPYTAWHNRQHQFRDEYGGDDVVWSQKQQYLPFLAAPTDPVSMQVYVQPDFYLYLDTWYYWHGGWVDMTTHVPVAGSRYVMVYLDAPTDALGTVDGVEFNPFPPGGVTLNIPACPHSGFPIAAVYLTPTTTEITWDVIYDVRLLLSGGPGTTLPGPHHLIDMTYHDDTAAYTAPGRGDMIYAPYVVPPAVAEWDVLESPWNGDPFSPTRLHHKLHINQDSVEWLLHVIMPFEYWHGTTLDPHNTLAYVGGYSGGLNFQLDQLGIIHNVARFTLDLGVGTRMPLQINIGGEGRAITIQANDEESPTLELYRNDTEMVGNPYIGIIRWFSGYIDGVCTVGQIDMTQTGMYDTAGTMEFWASDGCALCLVAEMECGTMTVHGDIVVGNAHWIGNGAASASLGFDSAGVIDYAYFSNCNVGIGTLTPQTMMHLYSTAGIAYPRLWLQSEIAGATTVVRTGSGLQLSSAGMNATNKYTPMIKFMSTDSAFTTENPKLLAYIIGRATEAYSADTDGGMAIDIATTPDNPGAASVPVAAVTIGNDQHVGIGDTTPIEAQLVVSQASTTAAIPCIYMNQEDQDKPFYTVDGNGAMDCTKNIADTTPTFALVGYYRIHVEDDSNIITDGDYWVPFYSCS